MMATLANVKADSFLKAFWTSRHGRIQNPYLFEALKKQYANADSALNLSMDMLAASEQYAALESPDDPVWSPHTKEARETVKSLKVLSSQQIHPVVLAALNRFTVHETERLLRLLEVLLVRYQLIGGERTGILEIACARVAKMIHEKKIATATDAFKEFKEIYITDSEFQASFTAKQETNNSKIQYLLRGLEREARRIASPGMSDEEDIGILTVEHILPKNPGPEWNDVVKTDQSIVEDCVYRLGNMCLLTKINKDLGNSRFAAKKPVYEKSALLLTQELCKQNQWDRKAIEHRQARMGKLAATAWRFQ